MNKHPDGGRVRRGAPILLGLSMLIGLWITPASAQSDAAPQPQNASTSSSAADAPVQIGYGHLPLAFEANVGQVDPAVDFLAHGSGYTLSLSAGDALLSLGTATSASDAARSEPSRRLLTSAANGRVSDQPADSPSPSSVRLTLLGANQQAQPQARDPSAGRVNYLIGDDPSQWLTDIPTYGSVAYSGIYPGIDVLYDGRQGRLEYTFVVAPGTDPSVIRLGLEGADSAEVDSAGDLVMHTTAGDLRQASPVIYQEVDGRRQPVAGGYVLTDATQIAFVLGGYDTNQPLVIDPVLVFSTFLAGTNVEPRLGAMGNAVAVDKAGSAYVTGVTSSSSFPTTPGAFQPKGSGVGDEVFVTKLNPTGSALVYSTFLGGLGGIGTGIALDAAGNAYVTGQASPNFPTTPGAFQQTGSNESAFVTKLNPTGSGLVYSTFVGSSGIAAGIAVDAAGSAYITGAENSSTFPTTPGAYQRTFDATGQPFVAKLNPRGTALDYSTFLGSGTVGDQTFGIGVDTAGSAYIVGVTASSTFPTTAGAFLTSESGDHAFVSKLNPLGSGLVYSTYLGGTNSNTGGFDLARAVAVDATGDAYVTGRTTASDFPTTPGALQRTYPFPPGSGQQDAFVTRLNATGSGLVYSTYLGGDGGSQGYGIGVDATGDAYITGFTSVNSNFPITIGAFPTSVSNDESDAFVSELNPTGTGLVYSTFLGGTLLTTGFGMAVDAAGNAYVTGFTNSSDFPTTPGAFDRTIGGGTTSGFVSKISPAPPACAVVGLLAGPPTQLQVGVHADRGLANLVVTQAANATVSLPTFAPGTNATLMVTATKINQSEKATFTLDATDQTGSSTSCDPALLTVGREAGETPVQILHHVAEGESLLTVVNGTPGMDGLRIDVNGDQFELNDLQDGESQTLDVSSAMRKGSTNTLLVIAHGPRDGSATVMVSDS